MEEEIDKVKTWAEDNVQPDDTDDKPEETPAKEEKPEENPLDGDKKGEEPAVNPEGDKPEGKKEGEGENAKGFGVEGHTPKGVQERFNEMSRSNRELKERNAALEARIKALEEAAPKPKEKDRNDFATDEEWINHLAEKKATEMFNKNIADWEFNREMEECKPRIQEQEESARKVFADFDEVMSRQVDLPVDRETYRYVMKSALGTKINYTLRKVDAIRQQFISTPVEGRLNFVKGVENRLKQIDEEVAKQKQAAVKQEPQNTPPANEIRLPRNDMRNPVDVKRTASTRLDPATCSMEDWMENGD